MRLVHLADLHLGFRQFHRVTAAGINQREADVASAFRRAVDRVIDLAPDLIVVAGDVFHSVRPMNVAIIHAFHQFARLRESLPGSAVVVVAGNHDRPRATETGCILRLFTPLGVHVVDAEPQRIELPEHSLSVFAVPDMLGRLPPLTVNPGARFNVLVMHGEIEGLIPGGATRVDRYAMEIPRRAVAGDEWSYVALGHYHVHRQMGDRAFYSGALDYTSTNPWGELAEERSLGLPGKGFIVADLELGTHEFIHLPPARPFVDLPAINAVGMTASDLDAAIRGRVESCPGGIEERVVRLIARDVPRHVARELDQRALREYKRHALHFQLDTRRPQTVRMSGSGAPGRRPTLPEMVESYLSRRQVERDLDRAALVRLGMQYLREASTADEQLPVSG